MGFDELIEFQQNSNETVNGIPIEMLRLIAERYPQATGGVYVDPTIRDDWSGYPVLGKAVPPGRILLRPEIPGNSRVKAAVVTFLHEVGHHCLGHVVKSTPEEIKEARRYLERFYDEIEALWEELKAKREKDADTWAEQEYSQLESEGVIQMVESEVTQKELEELRRKRQELDQEISQLEAGEAKRRQEIAERQNQERKVSIESQLRTKFPILVDLNWRKIPEFMNRVYDTLTALAKEYDQLADEEKRLEQEVRNLKASYQALEGNFSTIHNSVMAEMSSVKIHEDLRHLLDLIVANQCQWTNDPKIVLRFLDVHRTRIKSSW